MAPADIITFSKVTLRDGREVKALVEEPQPGEPVSRLTAFQLLLGSVLIFAELEALSLTGPKLSRRIADLRDRMEDAIAREKGASR